MMAGRRRLALCVAFFAGRGLVYTSVLHGRDLGKVHCETLWGQSRAGCVWKAVGLLPQDLAQSETLARLPPVSEGGVSPGGK